LAASKEWKITNLELLSSPGNISLAVSWLLAASLARARTALEEMEKDVAAGTIQEGVYDRYARLIASVLGGREDDEEDDDEDDD